MTAHDSLRERADDVANTSPKSDTSGGCVVSDNLLREIDRLEAALLQIADWQFPDSGQYWDEPENTRPMQWGAAFGSNGERDFMRNVAAAALSPNAEGSKP